MEPIAEWREDKGGLGRLIAPEWVGFSSAFQPVAIPTQLKLV